MRQMGVRAEQHKRTIFYIFVAMIFITIFLYNILTPYQSDDLAYKMEVARANSLWDLVVQQYQEYLSNSGRIIGQFHIRLSLMGSKMIFNVVNSLMFVLLTLLIYYNVRGRKKHDFYLLLLITGMLWRYGVEFGQTILWLCGACNYLWGSVIILGFVSFYRSRLEAYGREYGAGTAILCLLFGVMAGWCNENTSGGGLLLLMIFTALSCFKRKKEGKKMILPYMITGHLGMAGGLLGMLLAPGITKRAAVMGTEENFTGLLGYLSRWYKCCVSLRELFFELFCIFILVTVVAVICRRCKAEVWGKSVPFFFAALATSFALIMSPPPMERAYFGAGVFLMIACLQSFVYAFYGKGENTARREFYLAGKYIVVSVLSLWLFFTYIENLVNLGRIYREERERIDLIQEAGEAGAFSVVVPQYRKAFENPYSNAHRSDMTEDPDYWINFFYENYYEIGEIIAIPREEWNELYG